MNAILLNKGTMHLLSPHIETLLFEYMTPLFSLSPWEFGEFENDPHEYLQKEIETSQRISFKQAAGDLLIDLLKFKKNQRSHSEGDYIVDFLTLLLEELSKDKKSGRSDSDFVYKESILFII